MRASSFDLCAPLLLWPPFWLGSFGGRESIVMMLVIAFAVERFNAWNMVIRGVCETNDIDETEHNGQLHHMLQPHPESRRATGLLTQKPSLATHQ